jgi:hypothetical protein
MWHFDIHPRSWILKPVPDTLRVLGAAAVLFAVTGFGLVRLLLPSPLARYELLWVLPAGACATGLALTILGFAAVPFAAALPVVGGLGLALDVHAVRRRGWPSAEARRLAWPVYLALVVLAIVLVPMLAGQHYLAPVGEGSDAHEAAGVGNFLKFSYPTSVNVHQPINQMPQTWQSKYPIYYVMAAVSSISGLPTWMVLAPLIDFMLALASLGLFLTAVEVFAAPIAFALAATLLAALDRMALHTVLHPYYNQTWGFFAMPFTLVLGSWVVQPGLSRRARTGTAALLAVFAIVLLLAYPLAAPIPAVPLLAFAWGGWRRRVRSGQSRLRVRSLYSGWRSLLWMVPVAVLLAVPVAGVVDKTVAAIQVLAPGHSLGPWSGDLFGYLPFDHFFSLPSGPQGALLAVVLVGLAVAGLWGHDRALAWGLGGLLVLAIAVALYLRNRAFGYYFEFKLLAFVGPLVMLIAAIGAARLKRWGAGALLLCLLAGATVYSDEQEIRYNGSQLPQTIIALSNWVKAIPPGATIRLDMSPPLQLWVAYFLDKRPLCSATPLLDTDYPHVGYGIKADYAVAQLDFGRTPGAIGRPLRQNAEFRLWRLNPGALPGLTTYCTYRRYDRIYTGPGFMPR